MVRLHEGSERLQVIIHYKALQIISCLFKEDENFSCFAHFSEFLWVHVGFCQ